MIYFENASRGTEGLNTHVMSYTLCMSLSNFLDRDFFFDFEIPSSTPPDFAFDGSLKEKFKIILASPRSLVSDLLDMPARRVHEIERETANKAEFQLLYSYFLTTDEIRRRFENTILWNSFGCGRIGLTREALQNFDLIEWTHTKLVNPNYFYFLGREEKSSLLDSVAIKYLPEIESLADKIVAQLDGFNAVHLRLGDFLTNYKEDEYSVNEDRFSRYLETTFADDTIPVAVATDGLQEKELFTRIFKGYRTIFIDELIFDCFADEFRTLPFTDFNVLTILNQLICAASEMFVGTYRSTLTGIIHRLRQERYQKRDFCFFPDDKIAALLDGRQRIVPDRHGFFDWNRYSVFSETHSAMAWMREWDHSLSSIGLD